jgi:hypothetical protein
MCLNVIYCEAILNDDSQLICPRNMKPLTKSKTHHGRNLKNILFARTTNSDVVSHLLGKVNKCKNIGS